MSQEKLHPEKDYDPDAAQEIKRLNQRAREVAHELEHTNIEELKPSEKKFLEEKIRLVLGVVALLTGVGVIIYGGGRYIESGEIMPLVAGLAPAVAGLSALASAAEKVLKGTGESQN